MRIPKYQLKAGQELLSFEFISEGPKGLLVKRIQFMVKSKKTGTHLKRIEIISHFLLS
jgi:hypothetical protein